MLQQPEGSEEAGLPGSSSEPSTLQDPALDTSVPEDATQPQAPAPPHELDGQATLEMLERANLFIVPLDEERQWYRYHELFGDLLRRQLRLTSPESIPELHSRASAWYAQEGLVDDAIDHALHGEDFERAARLIDAQAEAMWQSGQHTGLRNTLITLPAEVLASRPNLLILRAWYLFASGHPGPARQGLRDAEQTLDGRPPLSGEAGHPGQAPRLSDTDRTALRGRASAIRAFMESYQGDVTGIIRHASQALDLLPEQDTVWRCLAGIVLADAHGFTGDMRATFQARQLALEACEAAGHTYYVMLAHLKLAITARERGQLARTMQICREQMRLADQSGLSDGGVVGWSFAIQGEVLAEMGDLDGGVRHVETGVQLAERGGDLAILGWTYLCLVRVLLSRGDLDGAEALVRKVERAAQESEFPAWITHQMLAWRARLGLLQGQVKAAFAWARKRGLFLADDPVPPREPDYFTLMETIVVARILIADERWQQANALLQRLLDAAEEGSRMTRVIEVLLLQALALEGGGRPTEALASLERALTLSEPEGFVRIYVDEGPPLARLLHEAARRGIAPDYARQLLAAFPTLEGEQAGESVAPDRVRSLIEPLSERELEVLQLIAEGLGNREIATKLFLSLNTVKAHTRNIYGKLDVHSRTQAVARSQALGLLIS